MSVRVSHFRVGLVLLFVLLPGRALADPALRVEAGASAQKVGDSLDTPGFALGGALALTRWTPLASLAFVPQLEVLLARRNAGVVLDGARDISYSLDVIEFPLLLRSELIIGSRSYYALAGGYGSVLLQAQSTDAGGIVIGAGTAHRVDVGFLAGGGFELAAFAGGELFIEARWQRGYRALLPGSGEEEALSLLLGYGLGPDTGDSRSAAQDRRLALKGGLVATRLRSPAFATSSYSPGFSLGGAFAPARLGSRLALVPQLEWAFVHRNAHAGEPAGGSLALDSIDLSMIARGELTGARGSLYGVAGVYGSALMRAQRTQEGVITDVRDDVSPVDAGWLAGAGIELAARAGTTLSIELRWQRGVRDLFPNHADDVTQQSVSFLFGIVHGGAASPRANPSPPDSEQPPTESIAALDAIEARIARLVTAMEAASTTRWKRTGTCHSRAAMPVSGVFASPDECAMDDARQETLAALRTVTLSLTRDLSDLVARLRFLAREEYGEYPWGTISGTVIHETVEHVLWMTDALQAAQGLLELADVEPHDDSSWQEAGRRYEAALLGAQVVAVWMSWLDVSRSLTVDTALDVELIAVRMGNAWRDMEPVLAQLRDGRIQEAARTLERELPAWSDALYAWGKEVEHTLREGDKLVRTLLLIQAVFEVIATRQVMKPLIGRATSYVFVLPGIGGITAGGAATGVRVVISAEWVKAMQHLVAIGAISTIEIARIAGVSSYIEPVPGPVMPSALQKDDSGASVPSTAGQQRPVQVAVQHKGGNQQVVVNGQRWHVPKGKSAGDIPPADPVGDRLQAEVDKIARTWNPSKLSSQEKSAIDQARAKGKSWLARLLEREARGRWVEAQAKDNFRHLRWKRKGVDAMDPATNISYEILAGTRSNLELHGKRMADKFFRMITF